LKRSALFVFVVAVTSICSGQWLERQVVIGDTFGGITLVEGGGIVVNPISGNVYFESDPVQVLNPVTRGKLRGPDASGRVVFCPPSGKGYVLGDSAVVIDATADTAIGTVALPFTPYYRAYSHTSNRVYLGAGSAFAVLDPTNDSVIQTIGVGAVIQSLLWDSLWNRLYVGTNADSGELKVFDCVADTLLAEIRVGLSEVWTLVVNTASHKLYCAGIADSSGGSRVRVVSIDSLTAVGAVTGPAAPDTLAYSPIANLVYGIEYYNGMSIIDCQADTVRTYLEMQDPTCLGVSTLDGKVYLGQEDSARVLVIDTTDSIVGSIALPTVPSHGIVALTFRPDRNELYGVTSPGAMAFTADASADTLVDELNYAGYRPRKMVHNPARNALYLLCPDEDEVLVMDSTFGAPKHILHGAVTSYVQPVLDPALNRLYVADSRWLRIIDCNSDSLVRLVYLVSCRRPIPVLVPYLNKLYLFDSYVTGGTVYAYDCLRDTAVPVRQLSGNVYSAIYDPRSNRVFFAGGAAALSALDPVTDSVVRSFDLGSWNGADMAVNLDMARLYFTSRLPSRMFTIDLLADSVIACESLPWGTDSMYLNQRLGRIYMTSRDTTQVLVFDCGQGRIVGSFDVGHTHGAGLMDNRNDKLYLRYGTVVDCRYDSVITRLGSFSPSCMAWDAIDNRVFQSDTGIVYVYRDDPYGVEEQKVGKPGPMLAVLGNPVGASLRLRLQIPPGQTGALTVYDAAGRRVHSSAGLRTSSFDIDVKSLSAGIYFVRVKTTASEATAKVIVQR
jgi:hypothetical protein